MKALVPFHNRVVAAFHLPGLALCALLAFSAPLLALDQAKLDDLYNRLATADADAASRIETEIMVEAAKSGSSSLDFLFRRGTEAMDLGDSAAAIEHLTAAIDHAPDYTEAYAFRAIAYFGAGDTGPALADLAVVLQAEPRHFVAWSLLGAVLEETDQPERALEAYRKAAAAHPHIAEVNDAIERLTKQLEGRPL